MNKLNFITSKIKNGMIYSFAFGFGAGLLPNKTTIRFDEKICRNASLPLITGCACLMGFIVSPLLIANYFVEGVYLDKLFDRYDISIARHHQYDGQDNKYAYPSLLSININTIQQAKEIESDKLDN